VGADRDAALAADATVDAGGSTTTPNRRESAMIPDRRESAATHDGWASTATPARRRQRVRRLDGSKPAGSPLVAVGSDGSGSHTEPASSAVVGAYSGDFPQAETLPF